MKYAKQNENKKYKNVFGWSGFHGLVVIDPENKSYQYFKLIKPAFLICVTIKPVL